MIVFYSDHVSPPVLSLSADDAIHCSKVLRHREGDSIYVIDGEGTMYECTIISASQKSVTAKIESSHANWHSHPYRLTLAVCPTKNNERYEWFLEKATEIGVDTIVPLIGERSERKVFKTERARKIVLSAAKQSLKAKVPRIEEAVSVRDFLSRSWDGEYRYIAYCFDDPSQERISLPEALSKLSCGDKVPEMLVMPEMVVMIGPEGDFSPLEASLALERGFIPVDLGDSRLRTETAAVMSSAMVYTSFIMRSSIQNCALE